MPAAAIRPRLPLPAIALAALLAAPAQGQSLLQLYQAAQTHDAPLRAAQAQAQAAQARADQARAGLLPQVGLQAGAHRHQADVSIGGQGGSRSYSAYEAALAGSQPLYRPANRIAWTQGQQGAALAQAQLDSAGQDLIVRLAQAYFDVLAAEQTLAYARALQDAVAQQLQAAQQHFEAGNATITDSREAQARLDLARAQVIAADNELRVKRLALEQLTGQNGIRPLPLAQPVTLPALAPQDVDSWVRLAEQQHPVVQQARIALDVARLETDKAKTGHLPTIDLQASAGQSRYPDGNPSYTPAPAARYRANHASIGVVLNWPLFAGHAVQNRVRETLALQDKAAADLENARRSVSQGTRTAFYGVQSGHSQVQALQAAEQSSLTALQANQLGYEAGVRINIDVLNAQSQLYQTRRELAHARYAVLVGQLRLKQAAGTLTEADLHPLNALLAQP